MLARSRRSPPASNCPDCPGTACDRYPSLDIWLVDASTVFRAVTLTLSHIYIYIYTWLCVNTSMLACMHACMYVQMYLYIYIYDI